MGNNVSCESKHEEESTMERTKRNPADETNPPLDVIVEMSDDNSTNFPRDPSTGSLVTNKSSPADETNPLLAVVINNTNEDSTNASGKDNSKSTKIKNYQDFSKH